MASRQNLTGLAITDHDTVAGTRAALAQGIPSGLTFLSGVEISAAPPPSFNFSGSLHILGYGFRIDDTTLNHTLRVLQQSRLNRYPRIIDKLVKLGMPLEQRDVTSRFGPKLIGRPHLAQLLVEKGFVADIDEAFDHYLGFGRPAYVDKERVPCRQAIEIILTAGGVPILAHPFILGRKGELDIVALIVELRAYGLMGIEAYYPEHDQAETEQLLELARRQRLLITGGTDFHGEIKPEIDLGSANGRFYVPASLLPPLMAKFN